MTPDQVLEMTLSQFNVLLLRMGVDGDNDPLHEQWKWQRMQPAARMTARAFKGRYGRF